jgi:type IV pilus assembly protein PilB
MKRKLLGERLLESGLLHESQLWQALQAQQSTGEQLGQVLVRLGYVEESHVTRMLCEDAGIPFTSLEGVEVEPEWLGMIPEQLAKDSMVLPLGDRGGVLVVALADPFDLATIHSVERTTGRPVTVVGAPRDRLADLVERAYLNGVDARPGPDGVVHSRGAAAAGSGGGSPGVPPGGGRALALVQQPADELAEPVGNTAQIVEDILQQGITLGATDIHIEPTAEAVEVRYRLDGILRKGPSFSKALQSALLTRIKISGELNIAESRMPQDGRMRLRTGGREVDLRISTFPTMHGEDLVLRVLDRGRVALRLDTLGLDQRDLDLFRDILARPHGLILITGPTGSGKTTTLYSALAEINRGDRCILTLEDPIEYELDGVRQSQINLRAGLTFASGLRAMLRHDPDVILVGEMRDQETAEIGLRAAMTGHMVLTTLHTNTAAGAIPRLLDMGIEPFALASSLQLAVAQRLVRLLCRECREEAEVPTVVRRRFGLEDATVYRPHGCSVCNHTGYRGRVALFELLPITEEVALSIYERRADDEIQRLSNRPTLFDTGLARVRTGDTSLEELLRIVSLDSVPRP